ncbi:ankyrin repeat domain-containing protein [archaeon]|nr:ankyrin repeat domain-containing protein [archaeon]
MGKGDLFYLFRKVWFWIFFVLTILFGIFYGLCWGPKNKVFFKKRTSPIIRESQISKRLTLPSYPFNTQDSMFLKDYHSEIRMLSSKKIKYLISYKLKWAKYFLKKGLLDINDGELLLAASENRNYSVVRFFLKLGVSEGKDVALYRTLTYEDLRIAKLLLKNGADPNKWILYSPLQLAITKKNIKLIKLLLKYGADPSNEILDLSSFNPSLFFRDYFDQRNYEEYMGVVKFMINLSKLGRILKIRKEKKQKKRLENLLSKNSKNKINHESKT